MSFRRLFSTTVCRAAPKVKEYTGIVGLDVVPDAKNVLIKLYDKTLNTLETSGIPKTALYYQIVKDFTNSRKAVCQKYEEYEDIESEIGMGQLEELIEAAKDELKLIPFMAEHKPWEGPEPEYYIRNPDTGNEDKVDEATWNEAWEEEVEKKIPAQHMGAYVVGSGAPAKN